MNMLKIVYAAVTLALAGTATAQDTNALRTHIGAFEARTDALIVKGYGPVGSLPLGTEQLDVGYKQTKDIGTGQEFSGMLVEITTSQSGRLAIPVDADEVDSLVQAVDYLTKIKSDVTSLPGFEASFTTKAGFGVIAHGIRKEGAVQISLKFEDYGRIPLTPVQVTQFYNLLQQARKNLAALKSDN